MRRRKWLLSAWCLCLSTGMALADKADSPNLPAGIDPGWYGQVLKDIQTSEYHITRQEQAGAYQSPNRAQNLRFTYFDDGFAAAPRERGDHGWKVRMALSSFGRTTRQETFLPGQLLASGDQAQMAGSGLTIRYKNGPEGMRQDFVIEQAPLDQGELMLVFSVEKSSVNFECSDGQGLSFVMDRPGGAAVYSYSDLKVYDAGGQTLPGRFQRTGEDGFAIVVDDSRAAYPVTIDPLSTSPNWTAESNQDSAYYGRSVAPAGDINGDGYSDVIIGAYYFDNGQANEGRAFVYHGSASGLSATANWTAEPNQANAYFGASVATAGDVNGDGYSDVVIGAYAYDNSQTDEGRAFVYHGSASGLSAGASWSSGSGQYGAYFGYSVAPAGDVNGDGFSDLIVGAPNFSNGQSNEGRAFVYHGSASGLSATADWTAESNQADSYYGRAAATAGDLNGDGYSDVIVGAFRYDNGQTDEGRAFAYHGSASGLSAAANWTAESDQANAYFGLSVATAGDVNGDGYSDVVVGARSYDNGQTDEGRAYVYHGSSTGLSPSPNWTAESDQSGAAFGFSVAPAGDVNGDGYSEVIVGAYLYDNGQSNEGRAFVYHGSASGLSAAANWTAESDQAYAELGWSVAPAGDVNGDGYSDVIVGATSYDNGQGDEGRAYVYHGGASGLSATAGWTAESNQDGAGFGNSVAPAGDVNGDGFSDVVVGAYLYDNGQSDEGRAFVYHGSASGLSDSPAWTAEPDQASAYFGWSAATAGDVNGDGYGDLIVGAYMYDNGQSNEGRAYVYHGSSTGLSSSPNWTAESDQDGAYFGYSVAPAGDVNGDGYSDVVVGARAFDNGQADEGRAYVYHGSSTGLSPSPNWTAESDQDGANFGLSVAPAGDVNGDGCSDLVVGANGYDNGLPDQGRVYVFHGSAAGLSATAAWTAESDQASSSFGYSVGSAGDVNGDGYSDVIVGAYGYDNGQSNEGRAYVYYGNNGGGQDVRPGQFRTDLATPVVPALKTNASDQAGLGLWGRTYYGRGDIKAQFEVKPLGTPFNGAGLSETGWFDSQINGAQMSQVVALSPGTRYKWRARTKYKMTDGATQPYGRWIYQPYNGGLGEADFCCLASDPSAVHLSYFTAARVGSGVELKWRTESEEDSDRWVIERKPPADENYKPIGELAAQGMSNLPHDYTYFDKETLEKGEYHYRIGEVDKAGNTVYYGPVSVGCLPPDRFLLLPASPNPSGGKAVFRYQLPREAEVRLEIYNVVGQKVKSLDQGKVPAGQHLMTWEYRQLPNGVYLFRLVAGELSTTGRLIVIR